jgi:GMP synthase-like glutamine amidotransferase
MRVLVLQHHDDISAGHLGDVLGEADADVVTVMVHDGEPFPDLDGWDGIVVLGALEGVYDDVAWIAEEREFLADVVGRGIPTLGICFGSQILADVLGGRAYKAEALEADVLELTQTFACSQDPVLCHLDGPVVSWHQDTWDPPPGATMLASSDRFRHAFRRGNVVGIQGHPEAGLDVFDTWVSSERGREQLAAAGVDADAFRDRVAATADLQAEMARRLFGAWVGEIGR